MAYSACLHEILKTLKWKHQTQHFRANYIKIWSDDDGEFEAWLSNGKWALTNTEGEWAPAPAFIVNALKGWNTERNRGPFVFKNGFDETDEAHYLIQMLQYPTLTHTALKKVDSIVHMYSDWISYDIEVRDILRRYIKWL